VNVPIDRSALSRCVRSAPPRIAVFLAACVVASPASGQTAPDSVVLRNGNIVHGEVQGLSRGKLAFDTDAMDVVSVDWDDILFLTSELFFEVTDIDGRLLYGRLASTDRPRVLVVMGDETVNLPFAAVVGIRGLAQAFWDKTSGYVDLGANLARANNLRSLRLKGHTTFEGQRWAIDLDAETYYQSQTSTGATEVIDERTSRNSGTLTGRRFLNGLWAATTSLQAETNEELSLDLRTLMSLGGRYNIIRNQGLEFYVGASAVFNRERFVGEDTGKSGEAKVTLGFDMFDLGDIDVYMLLEGYEAPASGRVRANLDGRIAWEVIDDFTIGVSATERYDSMPAETAEKRDFQYSLTLGWSWG